MTDKEYSRRFFLKTSAAGLVAVFTARGMGRSLSSPLIRPESGFEIRLGPAKGFFSILFDGESVIRKAYIRVETEAGVFSSFHERFVPRENSGDSEFHLQYSDKKKILDMELKARRCEGGAGLIIEASIRNRSAHQLRIKNVYPVVAKRERGGGFRSWKNIRDVKVLTDEWERCYGAAGVKPLNSRAELRSAWDVHVFEQTTGRTFSASYHEVPNASLSFSLMSYEDSDEADLTIRADTRAGNRGGVVPVGQTFRINEILLLSSDGPPTAALGRYAGLVARRNNASPSGNIPVGWVDWYFAKATTAEEDIMRIMDVIAQELKDYGLEYIQIDSGWQLGVETTPPPHNVISGGPWVANSRFPHGMKWAAERIREKGLRPGIWVRPFHVIDGAQERIAHPEWFNDKGQMDFSNLEAREYVRRIFATLVDDWGYEYIKYDFPSYDLFGEWGPKLFDDTGTHTRHRNQSMTNIQAYRESLEVVQDAVRGKARLLACNSVMPPTVGLADVFRIGDDIGNWERTFTMGVKSVAARYYTNGIYWWNDPDCLLVGEPFTLSQAQMWASLIALTGGAVFISEDIRTLPPERLDIIKKVLPVYVNRTGPETFARPVDFLENSPPEIWNLTVRKDFGAWNVVGVFNWSDEEKEKTLDFSSLDFPPGASYCVHEFWKNEYAGEFQESLDAKLAPWSCSVFAIRAVVPRPQVVSTSRHITQGGVELNEVRWDRQRATLAGVSQVIKQDPYDVSIRVPPGFRVIEVSGAERMESVQEGIIRLKLFSDRTTGIPWSVRFAMS